MIFLDLSFFSLRKLKYAIFIPFISTLHISSPSLDKDALSVSNNTLSNNHANFSYPPKLFHLPKLTALWALVFVFIFYFFIFHLSASVWKTELFNSKFPWLGKEHS